MQGVNIPGYNRAAQPWQRDGQYNSPAVLYSSGNRANEYLMQQGGLFGTEYAFKFLFFKI